MRIKLYLLAFAAALAMNVPAQASAVLGFAQGNSFGSSTPGAYDPSTPTSSPGDPNGTDTTDPAASFGVHDLSAGALQLGTTNNSGVVGSSAANPWVLTQGQQYSLQIQMVDYQATGGGFTFFTTAGPPASNQRLAQWGARLSWNSTPGVVSANRETPDISNNVTTAYNVGANNGAGSLFSVLQSYNNSWTFSDGAGNPTPNSVAFGEQTTGGGSGFNLPAPTGPAGSQTRKYILANVIITANAAGDAVLNLVDARPTANDFQTFSPVNNVDSVVFATTPQLFIHVVPEPSSMALAGMAIGGLVVRLRRKKNAVVA